MSRSWKGMVRPSKSAITVNLCGSCEGTCSRGVAISVINRCLMYAEAYGSLDLAVDTYREIPARAS